MGLGDEFACALSVVHGLQGTECSAVVNRRLGTHPFEPSSEKPPMSHFIRIAPSVLFASEGLNPELQLYFYGGWADLGMIGFRFCC